MSREDDFSISELRRKREQHSQPVAPPPPAGGYSGLPPHPPTNVGSLPPARPLPRSARPAEDDDEEAGEFHVDIWRMLGALKRHWKWLIIPTIAMGLLGFAGGYYKGRYTVAVKLIRRDVSIGSGMFKVEPLSPETMLSYIRSWDVARRVEAKAQPPVSAVELMEYITIEPEQKTDIVVINVQGKNTNDLVNLANLYAVETVAFTRDYQLVKPRETISNNVELLANLDKEIKLAESALGAFCKTNDVVNPKAEEEVIAKRLSDLMSLIRTKKRDQDHSDLKLLTDQLAAAKLSYQNNRTRLTELHPMVVTDRDKIALLEKQIAEVKASRNPSKSGPSGTNSGNSGSIIQGGLLEDEIASLEKDRVELNKELESFPEKVRQYVVLKANQDSLDADRAVTDKVLSDARQYAKNAEGYFRISKPVTAVDVDTRPPMKKAKSFGLKGAAGGFFIALALVLFMELKERTMKTAAEVERVTGLRVLSSLGDLDKMTPEAQSKWAFRAWTIIAGQLNASANHGMVCGFVSSEHGEGRSTWIRLLGEAATRRGLRVLTVATKPSGTDEAGTEAETVANEKSFTEAVEEAMTEEQAAAGETSGAEQPRSPARPANEEFMTLSPSALAFPAEVTQRFNSGSLPAAHIPLPGWVWNLDRRRQWQMALAHWRAIDNLVLLVELPPASVPESVLLAESLPQLIWLVDSGRASIHETKEQLEMMHHAKCQIVGAVLNHEPEPIIKL